MLSILWKTQRLAKAFPEKVALSSQVAQTLSSPAWGALRLVKLGPPQRGEHSDCSNSALPSVGSSRIAQTRPSPAWGAVGLLNSALPGAGALGLLKLGLPQRGEHSGWCNLWPPQRGEHIVGKFSSCCRVAPEGGGRPLILRQGARLFPCLPGPGLSQSLPCLLPPSPAPCNVPTAKPPPPQPSGARILPTPK